MSELERAKGYIAAAAEGLGKHSVPTDLPLCLREIARNINSLADTAERQIALALRAAEIQAEIDLAELAKLAKLDISERSED